MDARIALVATKYIRKCTSADRGNLNISGSDPRRKFDCPTRRHERVAPWSGRGDRFRRMKLGRLLPSSRSLLLCGRRSDSDITARRRPAVRGKRSLSTPISFFSPVAKAPFYPAGQRIRSRLHAFLQLGNYSNFDSLSQTGQTVSVRLRVRLMQHRW